ncbi:MAG: HAD family hydrolase [Puniceicoccaceae bacterium]
MSPLLQSIREKSYPLTPIPTETEAVLKPLPSIRAVIFDVYGTLFISGAGEISLGATVERGSALLQSLLAFVNRFGPPLTTRPAQTELPSDWTPDCLEAHFRHLVEDEQNERRLDGIDWPEIDIRRVWRRLIVDLSLCDEAEIFGLNQVVEELALDFELRVNPVWPMPELASTLAALRSRKYTLGIISNAQFFTPLLFNAFLKAPPEALGLEPSYSVWSYEIHEAKPSTFLYESVASALDRGCGIAAGEVLYVGNDRRNDVYPADAVGFRTALFAGDRRSLRWRQGDALAGTTMPDLVLTSLPDLLHCLPGCPA